MSFVKLQRHDIIKIEKGMKIQAITPDPIFCGKFSINNCIVGKVINYVTPMHNKTVMFQEALEKLLVDFDIPIYVSKYKEEMENFIKGLGLRRENKTFDTTIYEGEYEVFFIEHNSDSDCLIHCENLDNPLTTIRFYLDLDENKNVKILRKAKF